MSRRNGTFFHISAPIVQDPLTGVLKAAKPGVTYEPEVPRAIRRKKALKARRSERKRLWAIATGRLPNRLRAA